jgi:hypothetical protein
MRSTASASPVRFSQRRPLWLAVSLALIPAASFAAPDPADTPKDSSKEPIQEVVIFARGENLIGKAAAASEGAVGGADLSVRP